METLQASLQHTGVHMNASRRRSQQTMLGAMSSAVNMLPQNVDPKALGKKNILSSMDLRSLRVALRATWRRLHHLQGSLASAVTHADSTLSEYDRLKTTLPDALERQESLEDGQAEGERRLSAGDASHNSEEPKDHTKDQAELKKRRRKSVAATRTMLGQAISEFTSQVNILSFVLNTHISNLLLLVVERGEEWQVHCRGSGRVVRQFRR